MSKQWFLVAAIASLIALASCAPSPPKGTITISTREDFSTRPFHGTFEVTEGAEVLGCVFGSFVDTPTASVDFRKLTCESGERSGTFTIEFNPPNKWLVEWNRPWTFKEGTDDFSGLSGGGDFHAINDLAEQSGVAILTGEIQFSK